jgi:antitoxin component YwqK of YwqJK toxin-antitoxin module
MAKEIWNNLYVNGRKEGIHKDFNFDGTLRRIENYKNGVKHGSYIDWENKDTILIYLFFKNGMRFGQRKIYPRHDDSHFSMPS